MPKISVCIESIFTGPYVERVKRAVELGFQAIEFWLYDRTFEGSRMSAGAKNVDAIAKLAKDSDIEISNISLGLPDGTIGGSLVKSEDEETYVERLKRTIAVAHKLNCKRIITCTGNTIGTRSRSSQRQSIIDILTRASRIVEREGITLLLEPLNTLVDHQGYFLDSAAEGAKIVREINHPGLRMLYDIYHMQIMEGNIISTIEQNIDIIGHFHSAGVPGRHELWMGELNYPYIVRRIDELGYDGYFGLEYWPTLAPQESLRKTKEILKG